MRAKEYIYLNGSKMKHLDIISKVISDLIPIRKDKNQTIKYCDEKLGADIRIKNYLLQQAYYDHGSAMQQTTPVLEKIEDEIAADIADSVRKELFEVIKEDESFGYLFYFLVTEINAYQKNEPIDCLPDPNRIERAISMYRDDYPKNDLDDYINEDINYNHYNMLLDGGYFEDDNSFFLDYFNDVYSLYDNIRIRKNSISSVRDYVRSHTYPNEKVKFWELSFILTLINTLESNDSQLLRCKKEIQRIITPLEGQVIKSKKSNEYPPSPVYLSPKKGVKIDMIRILYVLYSMGMVTGENGNKLLKKDFFTAMGRALNVDLSNYDNDLARSLSDSTALDKHLKVFIEMREKMEEIFNSK